MTTLKLRAEAVADLREIGRYGAAEHGLDAAAAYLQRIDDAMDMLKKFPQIGMACDELRDGLRSLPVRQHHIFYRYADGHISVVRVLHKARDAQRWLE